MSLEDVFKQYNEHAVLRISTICTNSTKCIFDGIEECFSYFDKKPYRIVKLEIDAILEEKFDSNRITIIFDNREHASTEIKFHFNNNDDYLLLKNKIEFGL